MKSFSACQWTWRLSVSLVSSIMLQNILHDADFSSFLLVFFSVLRLAFLFSLCIENFLDYTRKKMHLPIYTLSTEHTLHCLLFEYFTFSSLSRSLRLFRTHIVLKRNGSCYWYRFRNYLFSKLFVVFRYVQIDFIVRFSFFFSALESFNMEKLKSSPMIRAIEQHHHTLLLPTANV